MATTSALVVSIDPATGTENVVSVDANIFGTGAVADRPASGQNVGDIYVVQDPGGQVWRLDIWDGTAWQILALGEITHRGLDQLVHNIAETSYLQVVRTSGRVSNLVYWTDSGMTTKIRETAITRTGGLVSQIVVTQFNGAGTLIATLTGTVSRSGGQVANVDWVLT